MEKLVNKFDPVGLVIGILSIIISVFSLQHTLITFGTVLLLTGIISIIVGIYKLSSIRPYIDNSGWITFSAIIDILVGILILFNSYFGALFISISFAIMFLMDSFMTLALSNSFRKYSEGYFWLDIIFSVIGIIFGILLLIYPILSLVSISFLVAVLFMTLGINLIVHSI